MDNWLDLFLDTAQENVSFNPKVCETLFLTLLAYLENEEH